MKAIRRGGRCNRTSACGRAPRHALTCLLLASSVGAARAQEPEPRPGLTPEVTAAVIAFYNDPATTRLLGDARLAAGSELLGNVAVLAGVFEVAGRVRGDVAVINGDLRLESGAEVLGNVTVVGGSISGQDAATITGRVSVYPEPLRYSREGDRLVATALRAPPGFTAGREFPFGRTELTATVQRGYNRVEGLPVALGGRVRLGHTNPTTFSGRLIYRTATGLRFAPDDLGYVARVDQQLGGIPALGVALTARSEIVPIETHGLSDRENSFATFLLHRDYRDHYEREGWAAALYFEPLRLASRLALEYRDERHSAVASASPWSLFDNDSPWRAQPAVARGRLRSLALRYSLDTRNDEVAPSAGWLIRAEVEQGLGGDLERRLAYDSAAAVVEAGTPVGSRFSAGTLDLRRYARLSRHSRLATRVLVAGSLVDEPLPPQRQHALGGEGSLPGYPLFRFDCGARRDVGLVEGESFFPEYGCDRAVLVQVEYDANLPVIGRALDRLLGPEVNVSDIAAWIVFFDAGRAWTELPARLGRTAGSDDFAADAGLGLRFGRVGFYWAVPLTGSEHEVSFFVRLDRRL